MEYKKAGVPLVVVGGKEYGTGSSRDWAAKGTNLLGVKAVLAESFERIHRSNLVGMGVLPLVFKDGMDRKSVGLDGSETIDVLGLDQGLRPRMDLTCRITRGDGSITEIRCCAVSIRWTRSTTTSTAVSCNTCCVAAAEDAEPAGRA